MAKNVPLVMAGVGVLGVLGAGYVGAYATGVMIIGAIVAAAGVIELVKKEAK